MIPEFEEHPDGYFVGEMYCWPTEDKVVVQRDFFHFLNEGYYGYTTASPIATVGSGPHVELEPTSEVPLDVIGLPESYLQAIGVENPPRLVEVAIASQPIAEELLRDRNGIDIWEPTTKSSLTEFL